MQIDLFAAAQSHTYTQAETPSSLEVWAMVITAVDRLEIGQRIYLGNYLDTTVGQLSPRLADGDLLLFFASTKATGYARPRVCICQVTKGMICPRFFAEGGDWASLLMDDVADLLSQKSSLCDCTNEELLKEIVRRKVL